MNKKILTLTELTEYLGIPRRTLYDMLADGRFNVEPVKGMKPRRWSVAAVDQWLESK